MHVNNCLANIITFNRLIADVMSSISQMHMQEVICSFLFRGHECMMHMHIHECALYLYIVSEATHIYNMV